MSFKQVNTSNLMTIECCFLISKIMRIAMQCHPSLYYVMYLGTLLFVVQFNVFISLLWFYLLFTILCYGFYLLFTIFFSDAADNEHSQLVEIPVERSNVPRSLQLKKYVIFKNRNMQLRFEIAMADIRDQLMTNGKLLGLS